MNILALLQDDARQALERSLTGKQRVTRAGGAASIAAAVREGRCDALVFDPGALEDDGFEMVMAALNERGVPALLYATLGPVTARRILEAVGFTARELVFRGSDDAPELLRRKLAALVEPSAPAIVLSKAGSHFRAFPGRLQAVAVSLFGRSALPRWVDGLVQESGLARRTVDRWMHKGGIAGAARLLDVTRLARVWDPLVDQGLKVEQVAATCGYARLRLLTAHSRRLVGASPMEIGHRYTKESFSERLVEVLTE